MKKISEKILAMFLAVLMCVSMLPVCAFAEENIEELTDEESNAVVSDAGLDMDEAGSELSEAVLDSSEEEKNQISEEHCGTETDECAGMPIGDELNLKIDELSVDEEAENNNLVAVQFLVSGDDNANFFVSVHKDDTLFEQTLNIFYLKPGEYCYNAYRDGFIEIIDYPFVVTEGIDNQNVVIDFVPELLDEVDAIGEDLSLNQNETMHMLEALQNAPVTESVKINPIYENIVSEQDIIEAISNNIQVSDDAILEEPIDTYNSESIYFYPNDYLAGLYLREELKKRTSVIEIYMKLSTNYTVSYEEGFLDNCAYYHTANPTEGDYISYQYSGTYSTYVGPVEVDNNDGSTSYLYHFTIQPVYFTSYQQEQTMNSYVSSFISNYKLNTTELTDFEKIEVIYDYICKNITYDKVHLNDNSYKLQYTGYAALVNKTAVCQGYSVLFYRLCLELGIDVRVVPSNSMNHAWNMVKVGSYYYFIDSTWDAQGFQENNYYTYTYFMRGSNSWVQSCEHDLGNNLLKGGPVKSSYLISTYDMVTKADITVSNNSLTLNATTLRSDTITVTVSGRLPSNWEVKYVIKDTSCCSAKWGEWDGLSVPLTITPQKAGVTSIDIYLYNSYTGKTVASNFVVVSSQRSILTFSEDDLIFDYGADYLEETIEITAGGGLPDNYYLHYEIKKDNVTAKWGEWSENTIPLTLTASFCGDDEVTVGLYDSKTDELLFDWIIEIEIKPAVLSGELSENTALKENYIYTVDSKLTVNENVTLTVPDNVCVFENGGSICVKGKLVSNNAYFGGITLTASGNEENRSEISLKNTYFVEGAILPALTVSPLSYCNISFENDSFVNLSNAINLDNSVGCATINGSIFENCKGIIIDADNVVISNNLFYDGTGSYDIRIKSGAPEIKYNSFFDQITVLENGSGTSFDAGNNYWFSIEQDEIIQRNSGETIIVTPLLDAPSQTTPSLDNVGMDTHKLTHIDYEGPSCVEDGCNAHWICEYCGRRYSDEKAEIETTEAELKIDSLGHDTEHHNYCDSTCTEDGNCEYWLCTRCNTYFADSEETIVIKAEDTIIEEKGHDFVRSVCSRCGEPDGVHAFGGTCGENAKWILDIDGVLTISGTGAMEDYASGEAPWSGHADEVTTLQIEEGVTRIGENAFVGLGEITEVTIPESVEEIGAGAFGGCGKLETVSIPEGTAVGEGAFEGSGFVSSDIKPLSLEKSGEGYKIDGTDSTFLQLEKQFSPKNDVPVTWTSSDESVAVVDENGLVTFKYPGTVTITVTSDENPEQTASVTFEVVFADKAEDFKLVPSAKNAVTGESITVTPKGDNEVPASKFSWSVISGSSYVEMTAPGVFTAVKGGGTVTVQATLTGDPLNRSASVSFTTSAELNTVNLMYKGGAITEITSDFSNPDRETIFTVTPEASADSGIYKYKVATSDKNVADVKDLKDGSYNIILSSKNTGACTITFTPYAKVNGKDTAQTDVCLEIYIRDYAPKTETAVTMNTYSTSPVSIPVAECEDNPIISAEVTVLDCNTKGKTSVAANLKAEYKDGFIELTALDTIAKSGSYRFVFATKKGEYSVDFKLNVKNVYPKVTLIQQNVLKLYDTDDKAIFNITVADGAAVTGAGYTGTGYDCTLDNGTAVFTRNADAIKAGKLNVSLEGYRGKVAVSASVKTAAKPVLSLSTTASTVAEGKSYEIRFRIYDKTLKKNLENCIVSCEGFTVSCSGEEYILTPVDVNALSGKCSLIVKVSEAGWNVAPVALKYALTVQNAVLPTVSLKAATLTLNAAYPELTAETALTASQSNAEITASFRCDAVNADKLKVEYADGTVTARLTGTGTPVAAGSYKFTGTVKCGDNTLKPVTLTVKVVNTAATLTAKATGKLDVTDSESRLTYTITAKNLAGDYSFENAEVLDAATGEGIDDFIVEQDGSKVTLALKDGTDYTEAGKLKTYSVKLRLGIAGTEKTVTTPKLSIKLSQSALKVKADAAALTVYQSQTESRTVVYTVRVSSPNGAEIDKVTLGSLTAIFRKNLADAASNVAWSIAPDGKSVKVYVTLKNLSRLNASKTYVLPLVITPEGAADTKADAKINLTLKVMK